MERIDKFVADRSEMSRKDVKSALRSGAVKLNGNLVNDPSCKIDPEKDEVSVYGKVLLFRKNTYIMLNKPDGYVSSTRDGASPTVLSLVPEEYKVSGLFPAGRLDKDSEGFVLITDDGDLAHRMLSPKKHLPKYYLVRLTNDYDPSVEELFEKGLIIDHDEQCLPAKVSGVGENKKYAFVELHEGKFHQVKRMFEAVGNHVEYLFRTQIGGLYLDEKLEKGKCRELTSNEVKKLFEKSNFSVALNNAKKSIGCIQ